MPSHAEVRAAIPHFGMLVSRKNEFQRVNDLEWYSFGLWRPVVEKQLLKNYFRLVR